MKSHTAPVSGFARSFISGFAISDATITILEKKDSQFKTDTLGKFGPIFWPIGESITLILEKAGYRTTQSATIKVPPEGINDVNPLHNISFQVPSHFAFCLFSYAMGIQVNKQFCQVAATITPPNTTMGNIPQGEADVKVKITPDPKVKPFYFGIIPFLHKTSPFDHGLQATSLDGGIVFANIPEGTYTIEAIKAGKSFSQITVIARKGMFVNASPPQGIKVLEEKNQTHEIKSKKISHFNFFKPAVMLGVGAIGLATCGAGGALAGVAAGYLCSNTAEYVSEHCKKSRLG